MSSLGVELTKTKNVTEIQALNRENRQLRANNTKKHVSQ